MALSSSQIAHLIELVQSEGILWNISAKEYRDTEKKKRIWQRIGSKFNVDGDEAYKIFRSLRKNYRREKEKEEKSTRSGSGSYRASNWDHMEALRFLEAHKKRRVYSSIEWEASAQNESSDSINIDLACERRDTFLPEDCPTFRDFSPQSCSQVLPTPQSASQLKPNSRQFQKNICDNSINSQSSSSLSPDIFTALSLPSPPARPSTSTTHPASQMECSSPVDFHQQTPRINIRSRGLLFERIT